MAIWKHSLAAVALLAAATPALAQTGIDDAQLKSIITGIGLKPTEQDSRYDFEFKATMGEEQWQLSMSAVLSQDGNSVWLMAWLDELPKSAADVPRTALLRLLAENDKLGSGKFFAYIANNRRFVLQRVVPTTGLDSDGFKAALQDLGASVVQTYPQWSVAGWKAPEDKPTQTAEAPQVRSPARAAINDSKFEESSRR